MKIVKFKKMSRSRYKVFLLDGSDIIIHEDIILKYNMLYDKHIDSTKLENILADNNIFMIYDMALKYIDKKLRCEKEIYNYLNKKGIEDELIYKVVDKLRKDGYLNEEVYIRSYINDKLMLSNIGQKKIKMELINLGFDEKYIDEELDKIDKDELYNKLKKLIDKKIIQSKNYSGIVLKNKITAYFIDKGFELYDIESILKDKDLHNSDQLKKEYEKLYEKYSKKYSGKELQSLIKQKLYEKGFYYD